MYRTTQADPAGGQRPAHDFGVQKVLRSDPQNASPEENEPAVIRDVRPEDKFAAAQRQPGQHDPGTDHSPQGNGIGQVGCL